MDDHLKAIDQVTATAIDLGMKFGPKLLAAIVIMVCGYFAGRWAARAVGRTLGRYPLDPPVRSLLQRTVKVLVIGLFLIMALQNLGVEMLPMIAGLGVAGAGIALALQGVLGNFAAGLTIIFSRPFRVGDYISIVKEEGEVLDISLGSTTLGHADHSQVVIPNRKIVGEILHNYGTLRQVSLQVCVSYDTDVDDAISVICEVLEENPRVLKEPAAGVKVAKLADSGVVIEVAPFVKALDYGSAGGEINQAILEAFRSRHIAIPAPQREIRVVSSTAYLAGQAPGERLAGRDAA
jgi:small conductance mechanosensitive channel